MTTGVAVEQRGGLRLLRLDGAARRNALSLATIARLRAGVGEAMSDPGVAGVALIGSGPHFCGGVDLAEMSAATPAGILELIDSLKELCGAVRRGPRPVVAAVHGGCVGGAFELAMAADFRILTADAWFSLPEVRVGMPSVIDAALLVRHVGLGRAREILLTGDRVDAARAEGWGLATAVVPDAAGLVDAAAALVRRVSVNEPGAVATQKRLIEEWLNCGLDEAIERSTAALAGAFATGVPQRLCRERLRREPPGGP